MTTISVALATYNGARFLREQLDSLAAQTLLPSELVITDDASTDDTVAIARWFAETAPFPVFVHQNPQRLGYRANFMHNMGLCTSDLIALCDQDDIWLPEKLERASAPFADADVLLVAHEAWLIDSAGRRGELARIYPLPERSPPLSLFPMRNPLGFSMTFRRSLLGFADLWHRSIDSHETGNRMAHDQWAYFLSSVFGVVAYIDTPLVEYRQHENNTYGLQRPVRTFWNRVGGWAESARSQYTSFSVSAEASAALLADVATRLEEPWRSRAREAVTDYRYLARLCSQRSRAFSSPKMTERLSAWAGLVRDGAYKGSRWAFGRKTAVKDLAYLLMPGPVIARLPIPKRANDIAGETRQDVALETRPDDR